MPFLFDMNNLRGQRMEERRLINTYFMFRIANGQTQTLLISAFILFTSSCNGQTRKIELKFLCNLNYNALYNIFSANGF